ncbi:Hypothetical protein (Fragment) [Durusdinium trenchii]|uniref:Uncharacterized protein n=1 Tax=Durusdinium trenchii TaxID=1381693 RepID=A0ABP0SMG2_9DINO
MGFAKEIPIAPNVPFPTARVDLSRSAGRAVLVRKVASQFVGPPEKQEQRETVIGGWRQVTDPVWGRPLYVSPVQGRSTWGVNEVLLGEHGIDPEALEIQKADDWFLNAAPLANTAAFFYVYPTPSLTGEPIEHWEKGRILLTQHTTAGRLIIVQTFDEKTGIATVLIPPQDPEGYVSYAMRDGSDGATAAWSKRPKGGLRSEVLQDNLEVLKDSVLLDEGAMVAPVDEWPELPEGQLYAGGAKPPEDGNFLEGPFFAVLPLDQNELTVSIGQDVGSDAWAKMPRGYRLRHFAEILGFRARLPDLEGGGWVSLCNPKAIPAMAVAEGECRTFESSPAAEPQMGDEWGGQAPELELPEELSSRGSKGSKLPSGAPSSGASGASGSARRKGHLPIVWPGLGIWIPDDVKPPEVPKPEPKTLPELLYNMGTGRALCDWQRMALPPYKEMVWKNRHAASTTHLHELLRLKIWKPAVVEIEWLHIREAEVGREEPQSCIDAPELQTTPKGSCIITQWVSSSGVGWADLGGAQGACVVLLEEDGDLRRDPKESNRANDLHLFGGELGGLDFWVEPQGGHIAEEDQETGVSGVKEHDATLLLRESLEASSQCGALQRGDVQIAELVGRFARVVRLKSIEEHDEAESEQASSKREPDVYEEEEETVPELLRELGELEVKSIYTRDWREAIDPIWGRRYFVNRWSGQVIHKLTLYGVAEATVKLTVYFNNLSVNAVPWHREEWPEKKLKQLEDSSIAGFAAMADVPDKRVWSVKFSAGPEESGRIRIRGEDPIENSTPPTPSEDSITGEETHSLPRSDLKVEVLLRAPGVKASWASASLQRLMANVEIFSNHIAEVLGSVPQIWLLLLKEGEPFTLVRADLEEMDIPRETEMVERARSKASEISELALMVDSEFVELKKNLMWSRPKSMQYAFHQIGEANARAMCEGLEMAYNADHARKDPSHLEEKARHRDRRDECVMSLVPWLGKRR